MSETSTKPYFMRAIYEWCTDNGYTPYLAVKVTAGVRVPMEYVRNGEIVLNISFGATSSLKMDNEAVEFKARFGGISRDIHVPVSHVQAIYASENGQGMAFELEIKEELDVSIDSAPVCATSSSRPNLGLASVNTKKNDSIDSDNNEFSQRSNEQQKKSEKPSLKIIK